MRSALVLSVLVVMGCGVDAEPPSVAFTSPAPGESFTRDQLAEYVWGGDYDPCSNVADVYVGYVRRKLQATRAQPLIHTVRGLGYMLKTEAAAS